MKKVLIIHGWYHSKERYHPLSQLLGDCHCDIVDLPGFGDRPFTGVLGDVEEVHIQFIREQLQQQNYDYIIAHSWGGRVALKALCGEESKATVILLNPAYGTNRRLTPLARLKFLVKPAFFLQKNLPLCLVKYPIKIAALFSINRWNLIDDLIIDDVRRADSSVATEVLHQMATSSCHLTPSQVTNEIFLLYSNQDRAISKNCFHELEKDLHPKTRVFQGVGHTLVLESLDDLEKELNSIIKTGGFSHE